MSICSLSRPSWRFQNRVEAYSIVSLSWLMRRGLSGQRGGGGAGEGARGGGGERVQGRVEGPRLPGRGEAGDAELHGRGDEAGGEVADAAEGIAGGLGVGGNRHASIRPLRLFPAGRVPRPPPRTAQE